MADDRNAETDRTVQAARLSPSMDRLSAEFRRNGGTPEDLKEILEMDDREFANIFGTEQPGTGT